MAGSIWGGRHQTGTYRPHIRLVVLCPACGLEHRTVPERCQRLIDAAIVSLSDRHRHRPESRRGGGRQ